MLVQIQNEILGRKPTVKAEMIKISERWIKEHFYMGPEPLFAKTVIWHHARQCLEYMLFEMRSIFKMLNQRQICKLL